MGCMCTRHENKEAVNETAQNKTYKWDEKKTLFDPKNFIVENLQNQEDIKVPGSINGQQFIIQNCQNTTVYVLDFINTVTIDDCINCKVVLGPVMGSVFIRNSRSCTCVVACGQFRVRDCYKINVFLFSATQPIIESSSGINFGSYQLEYKNIQNHFESAKLNYKDKNWKDVYDFTPVECEENWKFIKSDNVANCIGVPNSEDIKSELLKLEFSWTFSKESKPAVA